MLLNALGLSLIALVLAGAGWYFYGRKSTKTPQRAASRPLESPAMT
jgi:hypothetical protein